MFRKVTTALVFITATTLSAHADDVTDTLNSALKAYEDGDIQYALEELDYAKQLMGEMKAAALTSFLPEAPAGWDRGVSQEMNAGLAMLGGGVGAEAEYTGAGEKFTISMMADNPMVTAMSTMIGSAGLMGGKIERVGRQKFMNQDGDLTGLIDNRILIQAEGAPVEVMISVLETIDFKALEDFGD